MFSAFVCVCISSAIKSICIVFEVWLMNRLRPTVRRIFKLLYKNIYDSRQETRKQYKTKQRQCHVCVAARVIVGLHSVCAWRDYSAGILCKRLNKKVLRLYLH